MANEISCTLKLSVTKGNLVHVENPGVANITLNGSNASGGVASIGTSAEALPMGDTGTPGYAFFRNTDTTNYVEIGTGTTTFTTFMKLKAGEKNTQSIS